MASASYLMHYKAIEVQVEQRFRIHATLRTKIFAYIKSLSSNMGRWQAA